MKKNGLALMAAGVLVSSGLLCGGVLASAAESDTTRMPQITEANIGFTDHNINPTPDPQLDILWSPTSFDFGKVNKNNTAVHAYPEQSGLAKHVVVNDARDGANNWTLNMNASLLSDGDNELTGASYKFASTLRGYQSASEMNTEAPSEEGALIDSPVTDGSVDVANVSTDGVAATGTSEVPVMSGTAAAAGKHALEMNEIVLEIPANTSKAGAQYKGTITWALTDGI